MFTHLSYTFQNSSLMEVPKEWGTSWLSKWLRKNTGIGQDLFRINEGLDSANPHPSNSAHELFPWAQRLWTGTKLYAKLKFATWQPDYAIKSGVEGVFFSMILLHIFISFTKKLGILETDTYVYKTPHLIHFHELSSLVTFRKSLNMH